MTSQTEKAEHFHALHRSGKPLVLFNAWDAGSANAVAKAGAPAVATSSWAVAAAQGYEDGEAIPMNLSVSIVERMVRATDLPLTADIEGGYAEDPERVAENVIAFVQAGVVGINLEDRRVHGSGLYPASEQAGRIAAIRRACDQVGFRVFINARTDLFFGAGGEIPHGELIDEAAERAASYAEAGADGLFVPGLADVDLIADLCPRVSIPVNVMVGEATPPIADLARLGVRRVSFGPGPYIDAMAATTQAASVALA